MGEKNTIVELAAARRRKADAAARQAAAAKARARASHEKAVNWKAAPRFLVVLLLIGLLTFGVQWLMRMMSTLSGVQ